MIEIVILAMIAGFLGLRLYSVLGRRAEHEEEIVPTNHFEPRDDADASKSALNPSPEMMQQDPTLAGFPPAIERGLRDISGSDRSFELLGFMEGAKSAYEVILEGFWRGDKAELKALCDDDVYGSFEAVINEREEAGITLDNRLIRIEETSVHSAQMDGKVARIAVSFVSDIASVQRNKEGVLIAGSLDDAIESRDIWTFSRDIRSENPNWLLDETDEG